MQNQQYTTVLGCALENLAMDYFNCVIKIVATTIGFISFEIRSKQDTLRLYGKFLCFVDLNNV
jgi:hypothetical protein